MPTIKEYTENYNRWREMLQENAKRIQASSETRRYLMKNVTKAPFRDLLIESVSCIYNLTGDKVFLNQMLDALERRKI